MPMYKDLPKNLKKAGYTNYKEKAKTTAEKLLVLKKGIAKEVKGLNLRDRVHIASFNIRDFCYPNGKYKRGKPALFFLAEIIHSFDLVAIQEIKGTDEADFNTLMSILGPDYEHKLSRIPEGDFEHKERMAFVYNRQKVRPTRDAYNFREPEVGLGYARRPFVGRFQIGWLKVELHSVHLPFDYGKPERRIAECVTLAEYYKHRAPTQYHLILLGDFNTHNLACEELQSLHNIGFEIPEPLLKIKGTNVGMDKYYDQILYRKAAESNFFNICGGGVFDYYKYIFTDQCRDFHYDDYCSTKTDQIDVVREKYDAEYHRWRQYQMSDHLPLWLSLETNNASRYLESFANT